MFLYEAILFYSKHSICIFNLYSNSYSCSSSIISTSKASDIFAVLFLSIRSNHGIICKIFHWTTGGFSRNLFCDTTNVFSDFRHVNFSSSFMSSKQFSLKSSVSGKILLKKFQINIPNTSIKVLI